MNCTICTHPGTKPKYNLPYSILFECGHCKTQFLSPQPTEHRLTEIYSRDYYTSWGVNNQGFDLVRKMKYQTATSYLKKIKKIKPEGKLLDIGCAFGFFLEAARDEGFEPFGIEFSKFSSDYAKKNISNDHVHCGTIENSPFPNQYFDVITMFDLIEHTRQPIVTFQTSVARLKQDGLIVITTPDTGSWSNKLLGKKWLHYKEEHLFYFNRKSLNVIAAKAGLQIVHTESCKKTFNLNYVFTQFAIYKLPVISRMFKGLAKIIPDSWQHKTFGFAIGELLVILKKE
ncbi:MAG TPA: class I SAM-dependent methyltransferase [Marinilabiliales bacterium]|nr:MAG: hypothetical protein A2W84_11120 [Bacteroidetes bacterium GWC2_40_13]OFX73461.1 MAG: hypothetical protein A2W96_10935 [Bacteroidetes bacterium GWD2_40_43]OFX90639.1 MAG: hypothetical protein A2W97_02595 [Bacteroidetes bacterium GWE2_40_63]OFY20884.1 MAG: hypothetical protein A2W88_17670 [Bacteroidetes bacterium GWF2_40_13]OFZ23697.1 MAG: hypothetical protein A2437_06570 [Bacteroidetes bacterium RIFOXYC2_FULL_40_12]HAN00663.1 class I SAM-dependent methyltransferase [Marinilabiliales bac